MSVVQFLTSLLIFGIYFMVYYQIQEQPSESNMMPKAEDTYFELRAAYRQVYLMYSAGFITVK